MLASAASAILSRLLAEPRSKGSHSADGKGLLAACNGEPQAIKKEQIMSKFPLSRSGKIVASILALALIILSLGSITLKTMPPFTMFAIMCFAGTLWVAWHTRKFNIKGMKNAAYVLCFAASTVIGGL